MGKNKEDQNCGNSLYSFKNELNFLAWFAKKVLVVEFARENCDHVCSSIQIEKCFLSISAFGFPCPLIYIKYNCDKNNSKKKKK